MPEKTSQSRTVLLFQPQKMPSRKPVLQLLRIRKGTDTVDMDELPLTSATIGLYFKHLDDKEKKALLKLSETEIEKERKKVDSQIKTALAHQMNNGLDPLAAMIRYFHKQVGTLKHLGTDLQWYHRLPARGGSQMRTAPCGFDKYTVQLSFEAFITDKGPQLEIRVKAGSETWPFSGFRQFGFLLEQENRYKQLALASYEALDWLQSQPEVDFTNNIPGFLEMRVEPLRKKGQVVLTDALIERERLEVLPERQIMLSELNNTFLMLTPQFIYDEFLVDGPFEPEIKKEKAGQPLILVRNEQVEKDFHELLRNLHPDFERQQNGYYYLSFANAQKKQWFLKVYHQLLEMDVSLLGIDMLRHFRYSPHKPETEIALIEEAEDALLITFTVQFGKERIPNGELQKMLLNGQKAVLLKDGSLGVLGEEWLQQYAALVKHSRVLKTGLQVPRWMAMSDAAGSGLKLKQSIPEDWWVRWQEWQTGETALYPISQKVQVEALRPYQQKGYDWMRLLEEVGGSACLADDMGLGKTLQTICFMAASHDKQPSGKLLVVCPASLIYNWQQEIEKFAPSLKTLAYHGPARQQSWLDDADCPVIITSYGTMRQDVELLKERYFEVIVVDESHHIKNPAAQITRAAQELRSKTRIALSGTPVMNSTYDLYGQLHFLLPGLLGNREFFKREYVLPIEQKQDEEKAAALQKLIAPFILRRTKEQVADDLPEKTETVLWCEMGPLQQALYEETLENIRSSVLLEIAQAGLNKGKMSVLAGLTRLRQVCNSTELGNNGNGYHPESIKTDLLIDELQNLIGQHKVLVFSQFTSMLDLLEKDLQKAKIGYQRLDGNTAVDQRQVLVNQFQSDKQEAPVFLLSLKAGNAGLTLTAADYVFLFDPWWNVAVENQAIDRTHRIGQQKQVFAYRMICKGTIEEKILQMQQRKKKLAQELISTEEGFLSGLTEEDIRFLLA